MPFALNCSLPLSPKDYNRQVPAVTWSNSAYYNFTLRGSLDYGGKGEWAKSRVLALIPFTPVVFWLADCSSKETSSFWHPGSAPTSLSPVPWVNSKGHLWGWECWLEEPDPDTSPHSPLCTEAPWGPGGWYTGCDWSRGSYHLPSASPGLASSKLVFNLPTGIPYSVIVRIKNNNNSWQLLSAPYVPGIVLSILWIWTHLIHTTVSWSRHFH